MMVKKPMDCEGDLLRSTATSTRHLRFKP